MGELSGGNQQKVVIGRWLERNCQVLLFDEPTRGIDVGAKFDIYGLLAELARQGKALVVVSSDLRELMLICDRIAVLSAGRLIERHEVQLAPCHHWGAVGPMTGIVTASMPVFVVENRTYGNRAFATINEGLGKVLRFGANDSSVLTRLQWLASEAGPLFGAALKAVAELAPAQSAMAPAEQANVAAALTARMASDTTFAQQLGDPSRLSFGLGQNGDRLFAINHPVPDAPNAVHVSVDLEQARVLPIEASSGQADAPTATPRDPAHAQAIEAHAHEHASRQT